MVKEGRVREKEKGSEEGKGRWRGSMTPLPASAATSTCASA